jgi:outer membrane lipoprotein carrier protein
LDGDNVWVYLPDEKQVVKSSFTSFSSHIVADLFYSKVNIKKRFKVAFLSTNSEKNSSNINLELLPKEYNPTIKRLLLEIDSVGSLITKTVLEDELGTKTTLMFSEIKVDKGIEDSYFIFTPPPGVEILSPPKF